MKKIDPPAAYSLFLIVIICFMAVWKTHTSSRGDVAKEITRDFKDLRYAIHQVSPDGNYSQISNRTLVLNYLVPEEISSEGDVLFGPKTSNGKISTFTISGERGFVTITLSPVSKSVCDRVVQRLINEEFLTPGKCLLGDKNTIKVTME